MNISQKCNCCAAEDICRYKEVYQAGVKAVLNAIIPDGESSDKTSFLELKNCPHIEVSIKCPHMIPKGRPVSRESGV